MENNIEVLWMELLTCSQRLVGCVYRPSDNNSFYEDFKPVLEKIWLTRGNVLVTGDLNSHLLKRDRNGNKLQQILHGFNYKNLISTNKSHRNELHFIGFGLCVKPF